MFDYKINTTFIWHGTALYAGMVQVGYIVHKYHKYNAYTHNRKFIAAFDLQNDARHTCELAAIESLQKFEKEG